MGSVNRLRRALVAAGTSCLVACSWIHPTEPLAAVPSGTRLPVFEEVPVEFAHAWDRVRAHHLTGAAVLDLDGDGRSEIFVGGGEGQDDALLALEGGRLVDRIAGAGLSSRVATYGATAIDVDADGDVDLLVCRNDGLHLYRNRGGRFADERLALALPEDSVPLSVAVSDVDRDGDGDLYVSVFVDFPHFRAATFNVPSHAKRNVLLRNDGAAGFVDVTDETSASKQNTFTSLFVDLDGDRLQDLVVAQNTGEVEILHNLGGARFERAPVHTGYGFWMGIAVGDFDADGDQDLYFPNVGDSFPGLLARGDLHDDQPYEGGWLLLRNDGGFRFADRTRESGLAGMGFAWGAAFEDVNLDGRLDLLVAQNYVKWPVHRLFKFPGKVLLGVPDAAGPHFFPAPVAENRAFGNTPVVADLDGDALPDVFWLNNDGRSRAYLNRTRGRAVVVSLPDDVASLGARVHLEGPESDTREVVTSIGLGSDPRPTFFFGLGEAGAAERLVVSWADGSETVVEDPPVNRVVKLGRAGLSGPAAPHAGRFAAGAGGRR